MCQVSIENIFLIPWIMVKNVFRPAVLENALNLSVHKNVLKCLLKGRFGASVGGWSFTLGREIEAMRIDYDDETYCALEFKLEYIMIFWFIILINAVNI